MRRLLGAMRRDDDEHDLTPQPSLASVDGLVEQISGAGLPVHLHVEGEPAALPTGIELSAYRIIQEGLTNALKHGRRPRPTSPSATAEMRSRSRSATTAKAAPRPTVPATASSGFSERVKIYGGDDDRRTAPGRGFHSRHACPSKATCDDHPRPRRRRPGADPRRLPDDAQGRGGHRGRRRGRTASKRSRWPSRFSPGCRP